MSEPRNFYEVLAEWQALRNRMKADKEREPELRRNLFAAAFPEPREGTNTYALPTGQKFVGKYGINRTVVPSQVKLVDEMLRPVSNSSVYDFLSIKYELKEGEYKKAPAHVRAILDRMLTSKPAAPVIEIKDAE